MDSNLFNFKLAVALALLAFAANPANATDYGFSDLGTIDGPYAGYSVNSINNLGQVLGGDGVVPYVWNGNLATPLSVVPEAAFTLGNAINDAGQVAGYNYVAEIDRGYAYRWDAGLHTEVDTLGGGFISAALTINNNGQMAGASWLGTGFRPVRWDGTSITELPTLGGTAGTAGGMNNAGIVVGESRISNDDGSHATLWNGTVATDLGTLGGTSSTAIDINNFDQIVGWGNTSDDSTTHPIFWNGLNASPQDLGTLGGDYGAAQAINDNGLIVGQTEFQIGNTDTHAVLWNGAGAPLDLNAYLPANLAADGWVMALAFGINNDGIIIGGLVNAQNTALTASFQLTPTAVPIPAAAWLFGSALAGLLGLGGRKKERLIEHCEKALDLLDLA